MNKELIETLKYLRLGGLLAHWDEYLKLAAEGRFSHARLRSPTCWKKNAASNARTLVNSGSNAPVFPTLVIATFPFERQLKLNKKKFMALYDSLGYMNQSQNLL
jgi:hypothetical protein